MGENYHHYNPRYLCPFHDFDFFGLLPIPLVPVFYPQSTRLIGFITCHQLEQRTWYRCHSSGEFNGCESYMGVERPLIYELIFSRNCPDFTPPTYCGTC